MAKIVTSSVKATNGVTAWGTALSTAQLAAITTAVPPTLTTAMLSAFTTAQIAALQTTIDAVPLLVAAVKASGQTA